ncbi:M1 family metallopeptidase [Modestobacter lapidis]
MVELRFEVADDLASVAGWERITFTPDLPTCQVVLRAWPNKPITARAGNSLVVSEVRVDGRPADPVDIAAGAPEAAEAGTLLEVPLENCAAAGDEITVEVEFDVELGEDTNERMGTSADAEVAWFATAFPLLAWERGRGWERGPAVPVSGEMAVSEDFRLDSLEVVAPSEYEVLGTGRAVGTEDGPDGTTVHRYAAPAVRDVAVSVGDLDVVEEEIDGVRVHLGLDQEVDQADAADWLDQIAESKRALVDLLGPFPYDDLWVTVLSSQTSGIEFPGAAQFGDVDPDARRGLVTHELAHMWFYGLVGNDQGDDPWLDESFATFAQMVADDDEPVYAHVSEDVRPPVGGSMTSWTEFRRPSSTYYDTVYTLGGTALVKARNEAGHEAFDAALAQYLQENAYTVATPDDVREAFAELPEVLAVLRDVGALS